MRRIIFAVLSAALLMPAYAAQPQLKFRNGKFRVLQLTDLHLMPNNPAKCAETEATVRDVVKHTNPDLVVLTGDVVTYDPAWTGWKQIVDVMESLKVPFNVGMGNHDAEYLKKSDIYTYLLKSPYYVGELNGEGVTTGGGTCALEVLGADGKPASVIYSIDSNDYPTDKRFGAYDWIHFDQLKWYRDKSAEYTSQAGAPLPSLAFFHIPLPEYAYVVDDPHTYGARHEGAGASSALNSGAFLNIMEMGDIMGIFCGHDHDNDYVGINRGIALGFGRCTGAEAYGTLERGGRVIDLTEGERRFDTFVVTPKGEEPHYYYPSGFNDEQIANAHYYKALKVSKGKPGLRYTYLEIPNGRCKAVSQMNLMTEKERGVMPTFDISKAPAEDHFGYVFEGLIDIPVKGIYNFYTYSDDGSQLFIDGELVVDNDGGHSARRRDGQIALDAGLHKIKLCYFEDYMGEALEVGISSLEIFEQPIPADMLFTGAE
ncbi:MAG: metallophosphoesterase [Muribaculaceae bacterium]|nr:metallophosphoesterase [Muribaculaceae bacterium]